MDRVTLSFPSCSNSIHCKGCKERFSRSDKINLEGDVIETIDSTNKIWNKDCYFFQKELPQDYPPDKNHFLINHINHEVDVLLESTKEVIPALHAIMINRFSSMKEVKLFIKSYSHYIVYEILAVKSEVIIVESHQWNIK